jgi:Domain of unknown function (DUF4838)
MGSHIALIMLLTAIAINSSCAKAPKNLLGTGFDKMHAWGSIVIKPATIGKAQLQGDTLIMTRLEGNGDFKLYRHLPNKPGESFRFLCKFKKTGAGSAKIRIIFRVNKKWKIARENSYNTAKSGVWENVEIKYTVPKNSTICIIQFYPPPEAESSIMFGCMHLVTGGNETPAGELLTPLKTIKKLKVEKKISATKINAARYVDNNMLRNSNFKKRNFDIDTPLYWRHLHFYDAPKHRSLYSLKDGIVTLKYPFCISQELDITTNPAGKYVFSCKAKVESGQLLLRSGYFTSTYRFHYLKAQYFKASNSWKTCKINFVLKPEFKTNVLRVVFDACKKAGVVKIKEANLSYIAPLPVKGKCKLFLAGSTNMYKIRGIYVKKKCSIYELKAARILRRYFYELSGNFMQIYQFDKNSTTTDFRGMVLIGCSNKAPEVKNGGFSLNCTEGVLRIDGEKNGDGVIQGAYTILRNMGMEFFTASDYSMPKNKKLCISEFKASKNSAISYRFSNRTLYLDPLKYSDTNVIADPYVTGRWLWQEHTSMYLLDPKKYFKTHPEYFAMNKHGKRVLPQREIDLHLCMSNPKVQQMVSKKMLWWIKQHPEAKIFYLAVGDGHGWCQCEKCKKWDPVKATSQAGNFSDRNIRFVNIIAKAVAKKYPEKIIMTLVYVGCRKVPIKTKLEPNVWVAYCPYPPNWRSGRNFLCRKNADGLKELMDWVVKYPKQIFIYEYPQLGDTNGYFGFQPKGGFYTMLKKIRFYSAIGVRGMSFNGRGTFKALFEYVMGKALWNPKLDIEGEIDKFFQFYYSSEVTPLMRKYFNLVQDAERLRSIQRACHGSTLVSQKFFSQAMPILNKAIKLAVQNSDCHLNSIYRQKMLVLTAYLNFYNKTSGLKDMSQDEFAQHIAELIKLYKYFKITKPGYRTSVRDLLLMIARIDIGQSKPWYKSPIVVELLKNPNAVVNCKIICYRETTDGLVFQVSKLTGGQLLKNYQYKGHPKTKRLYARVLRRASSPYSNIRASFEFAKTPSKTINLQITGLDNEKKDRTSIKVTINGKCVFSDLNPFNKKDWTSKIIKVPSGIIKEGKNILSISNTTVDKLRTPTFDEQEAPVKDYSWGWFMISNIKLSTQ